MERNRRKFPRRGLQYQARIMASDGSWGRNCRILDISEGGAKLATETALELPNDFILALSTRGKAARRCHVVWSEDCEIGVEFSAPAEA